MLPKNTNFYTPSNESFYSSAPYKALDPNKVECRLLRFEIPSNDQDVLSCQLHDQVPLTARGHYSAISYYSGDPRSTAQIMVNGIAFNAFKNLDSAIRDLASHWKISCPGRELILWVDQICIDQSNTAERSHQVGLMREIYDRAERVFIHLNVPGDDGLCLTALQKIHSLENADLVCSQTPDFNEQMFLRNQQCWTSITNILNHRWWGRAWVYQEFIVAEQPWFIFGPNSCLSWAELSPLLAVALSLNEDLHLQSCRRYNRELYNRRRNLEEEATNCFRSLEDLRIELESLRSWTWIDYLTHKHTDDTNPSRRAESQVLNFFLGYFLLPFYLLLLVIALLKANKREKRLREVESQFNDLSHRYQQLDPAMPIPGGSIANYRIGPDPAVANLELGLLSTSLAGMTTALSIPNQQRLIDILEGHMTQIALLDKTRPLVQFVAKSKDTWSGPAPLSALLRHASNVHTSELRDKVYAFLGLTQSAYNLIPDYTPDNTIPKLLTVTAQAIITCERNIAIVKDALNIRTVPTGIYLPSWVPDWTVPLKDDVQMFSSQTKWKAGGFLRPVTRFEYRDGHAFLVAAGIRVDTLENKGVAHPSERYFTGRSALVFGTMRSTARIGDEVWILRGLDWPAILRKDGSHYVLIAEATVLEDRQTGGGQHLVESQILYGSFIPSDDSGWNDVVIR